MSTLTESLHSSGEKDFLLAFHSACVSQANIEYEAHLSQNPKITVDSLPFEDFVQSRLPFYQQAFELGLDSVNDIFYTEGELEVLDITTGKPRIYKYNFETNTVFYEKSVSKPSAKASAVEEVQAFDFNAEFNLGETTFADNVASSSVDEDLGQQQEDAEPEVVISQIYADPILVDHILQRGIESITRDYLDFASTLEKISREESQAWITIKDIPSVAQDLAMAREHKKALKALNTEVERVSWFANLVSSENSVPRFYAEALNRLEQAAKLTNFFLLSPSHTTDGRRINAENSFAVAMIGETYQLSRDPQVRLEDAVVISKIVYDLQKDASDSGELAIKMGVMIPVIIHAREEELITLLEENDFPVALGLEYFETILRNYFAKMPNPDVIDFLEGRLDEHVMYNLLYRHYQSVVDTRENKFQHLGLFVSGLKDGRFLTSYASKLEQDDFEKVFNRLFSGEIVGFTDTEIRQAILAILKHFRVYYNNEFDAFTPSASTGSGRDFESQELLIYKAFIKSLLDNFEKLPAGFGELMTQIRLQTELLPVLKDLQMSSDQKLKDLYNERRKTRSPWIKSDELKVGDRFYLNLDGFVEYYLHSVGVSLLNKVQEGSYYSRKIDYAQIKAAALSWVTDSTKRSICGRALEEFGLQSFDQLADYISIKMSALLTGLQKEILPTEGSIALQLENSLASLASESEKKRTVADFDDRKLTFESFAKLPAHTQLRLIGHAFNERDAEKRAHLILDLFELLRVYYRPQYKKFALRTKHAEGSLQRAKRIQSSRYMFSMLLEGLEKDSVLVESVNTVLMQYRFSSILKIAKPEKHKRALGSDVFLSGNFFVFYRSYTGKWPGSVGSAKALFKREALPAAVKEFCVANRDEIERKIKARNLPIKNAKYHYNMEKYAVELLSYAYDVFDRTYRRTYGVNLQFGRLDNAAVLEKQKDLIQKSLEI